MISVTLDKNSIALTKADVENAIKTCQYEFQTYGVSVWMDNKSKELVILTLAVSQKYTKSSPRLLKLLLDIYVGSVRNDHTNHQKLTLDNSANILIRTNSSPKTPKRVHFNSVDGSDVSPPNDRQPGSWTDTWQKVNEVQDLIRRLQKVVTVCCQQPGDPEMCTVLCAATHAMVQLSQRECAKELIDMLHDAIDTELTVGQLCATMSVMVPEIVSGMFLHREHVIRTVDSSADRMDQQVARALRHHMQHHTLSYLEQSVLRTKASWMLAAVVRFHLRWLLDTPPSILSTLSATTRGAMGANDPDAVFDEMSFNSHCRSAVWNCIEVQYEQPPLFTFYKDKRLDTCVHSIDCSVSPSSSSNLSYLFAEALRQIYLAVDATQSSDASLSSSSRSKRVVDTLLGGGVSLEGYVSDLLYCTHSDDYKVDLYQVVLGAEFARQFLTTLLSLLPLVSGAESSGPESADSVWSHMGGAAKMMQELGLAEDLHLRLLVAGREGLATALRRPFISSHTLNQCLTLVQIFYDTRLDELLRSYSQPLGKTSAKQKPTRGRAAKGPVELPAAQFDLESFEDMLSSRPILKFPFLCLKGEQRELQQKLNHTVDSSVPVASATSVQIPSAQQETEQSFPIVDEFPPSLYCASPDKEDNDSGLQAAVAEEVVVKASRRRRSVSVQRLSMEPTATDATHTLPAVSTRSKRLQARTAVSQTELATQPEYATIVTKTEESAPLTQPEEGNRTDLIDSTQSALELSLDQLDASSAIFVYDPSADFNDASAHLQVPQQDYEIGAMDVSESVALVASPPPMTVRGRSSRRASVSASAVSTTNTDKKPLNAAKAAKKKAPTDSLEKMSDVREADISEPQSETEWLMGALLHYEPQQDVTVSCSYGAEEQMQLFDVVNSECAKASQDCYAEPPDDVFANIAAAPSVDSPVVKTKGRGGRRASVGGRKKLLGRKAGTVLSTALTALSAEGATTSEAECHPASAAEVVATTVVQAENETSGTINDVEQPQVDAELPPSYDSFPTDLDEWAFPVFTYEPADTEHNTHLVVASPLPASGRDKSKRRASLSAQVLIRSVAGRRTLKHKAESNAESKTENMEVNKAEAGTSTADVDVDADTESAEFTESQAVSDEPHVVVMDTHIVAGAAEEVDVAEDTVYAASSALLESQLETRAQSLPQSFLDGEHNICSDFPDLQAEWAEEPAAMFVYDPSLETPDNLETLPSTSHSTVVTLTSTTSVSQRSRSGRRAFVTAQAMIHTMVRSEQAPKRDKKGGSKAAKLLTKNLKVVTAGDYSRENDEVLSPAKSTPGKSTDLGCTTINSLVVQSSPTQINTALSDVQLAVDDTGDWLMPPEHSTTKEQFVSERQRSSRRASISARTEIQLLAHSGAIGDTPPAKRSTNRRKSLRKSLGAMSLQDFSPEKTSTEALFSTTDCGAGEQPHPAGVDGLGAIQEEDVEEAETSECCAAEKTAESISGNQQMLSSSAQRRNVVQRRVREAVPKKGLTTFPKSIGSGNSITCVSSSSSSGSSGSSGKSSTCMGVFSPAPQHRKPKDLKRPRAQAKTCSSSTSALSNKENVQNRQQESVRWSQQGKQLQQLSPPQGQQDIPQGLPSKDQQQQQQEVEEYAPLDDDFACSAMLHWEG